VGAARQVHDAREARLAPRGAAGLDRRVGPVRWLGLRFRLAAARARDLGRDPRGVRRERGERQGEPGGPDDDKAFGLWTLSANGKEIFSMPRIALVRSILLNHSIHHRGQLSVYLRLLDIPVPAVYGPSADDNPFA
jgi:hypothetical protein